MVSTYPFLPIILLRVTPSANRNTYSVATLIIHLPRVEALHASTLGYEIATPTELPGVRTIQHRGPIPAFPKGKVLHATSSHTERMSSRPLGGMGRGFRRHGDGPLQAAATPNRRSPARRSASRKGNGVAFPQPQFGDQDTTISNYPMNHNEKFMEVRTICVKLYA